ncbi:hypothetical protein HPB47_017111 [Ixodes persulcatus]|uniref:Uncharacterized protein n=1 Tax=Ixodes persulcatus TaxID=34615 RepID=A0AC60R033_IXOPE|nr:hypothetical protein HPB47_017111 [Ixodes persulcatus]
MEAAGPTINATETAPYVTSELNQLRKDLQKLTFEDVTIPRVGSDTLPLPSTVRIRSTPLSCCLFLGPGVWMMPEVENPFRASWQHPRFFRPQSQLAEAGDT